MWNFVTHLHTKLHKATRHKLNFFTTFFFYNVHRKTHTCSGEVDKGFKMCVIGRRRVEAMVYLEGGDIRISLFPLKYILGNYASHTTVGRVLNRRV